MSFFCRVHPCPRLGRLIHLALCVSDSDTCQVEATNNNKEPARDLVSPLPSESPPPSPRLPFPAPPGLFTSSAVRETYGLYRIPLPPPRGLPPV
ncbi:unnamed protein product [Lota lota]